MSEGATMLIDSLVAQALDDLEEHRISGEAALRRVAELAWRDGYQQGEAAERGRAASSRGRGPGRPS
jgi:hypothetical protein